MRVHPPIRSFFRLSAPLLSSPRDTSRATNLTEQNISFAVGDSRATETFHRHPRRVTVDHENHPSSPATLNPELSARVFFRPWRDYDPLSFISPGATISCSGWGRVGNRSGTRPRSEILEGSFIQRRVTVVRYRYIGIVHLRNIISDVNFGRTVAGSNTKRVRDSASVHFRYEQELLDFHLQDVA